MLSLQKQPLQLPRGAFSSLGCCSVFDSRDISHPRFQTISYPTLESRTFLLLALGPPNYVQWQDILVGILMVLASKATLLASLTFVQTEEQGGRWGNSIHARKRHLKPDPAKPGHTLPTYHPKPKYNIVALKGGHNGIPELLFVAGSFSDARVTNYLVCVATLLFLDALPPS